MKKLRIDGTRMYSVTISEEEREEGILLQLDRSDFNNGEAEIHVKITLEGVNVEPINRGKPIEGHPNCYVGDCIECHNVACAIYQGYEPMP